MKFNALSRKAAKGPAPLQHGGSVEVEDLIRFVLEHGAEGATEIERLCALHGWREDVQHNPDGTHFAPMAPWARACAAFGHRGVAGLLPLLDSPFLATYAIGVLQDVRSEASVAALLAFCEQADFSQDDALSAPSRALAALNVLLSFDKAVVVSIATQQALLHLVQRVWEQAPTTQGRSMVLCAVRGAAAHEALQWVQTLVVEDAELIAARKVALKRLRQRL
ncbi:hypothetical protein [Stenotrophomonas sp. YAU14D1_LEIMI4_1]|uniref:hypothetical protein n=1 Tax=Stenotrophomonas sp. YAU14D1_LEIMI4_1 TaxID=2072407 RepID=UPI000D53CCC4|nr:hypothetical protein [Stenotrophomonas sp. YAU14D1_LEIMI4_1]AWH24739.1 hypothetical protein C1932_06245 [Stenotrophomonas sp. YAU14D1_LEIMI4_1]